MFLRFCLSAVRLQWENCVQFWTPLYKQYIAIVEKIQPRTTEVIKGLGHMKYEEKLSRVMSALKGCRKDEARLLRGTQQKVYKPQTQAVEWEIPIRGKKKIFMLISPRRWSLAYMTPKCLLFYELHFSHTISIYLVTQQEGKNIQLLSVSKRRCSLPVLMLLTLFMFMFVSFDNVD